MGESSENMELVCNWSGCILWFFLHFNQHIQNIMDVIARVVICPCKVEYIALCTGACIACASEPHIAVHARMSTAFVLSSPCSPLHGFAMMVLHPSLTLLHGCALIIHVVLSFGLVDSMILALLPYNDVLDIRKHVRCGELRCLLTTLRT